MEIKIFGENCIISPLSPILEERETLRLADELRNIKGYKIGLDLSYVDSCSIEFIEFLKNTENINLFNIPQNVFVLINLMKLDKIVNLFVSETDFLTSSHRLLNRAFTLVKSLQ